jgi:hypothetical protein
MEINSFNFIALEGPLSSPFEFKAETRKFLFKDLSSTEKLNLVDDVFVSINDKLGVNPRASFEVYKTYSLGITPLGLGDQLNITESSVIM